MTESEARDWVLVWAEDLHRRAGSKRFWEEEQERIDLGTCCLILSSSLWKVRPTCDCHSGTTDTDNFILNSVDIMQR